MNINDLLVDDCLLLVFHWLPLRDLIQIKAVCVRWNRLQRQVSCRVRKLTLLTRTIFDQHAGGFKPLYSIIDLPMHSTAYHVILNSNLKQLTNPAEASAVAANIANQFPGIVSLEYFHTHYLNDMQSSLFDAWRDTLHRLVVVMHKNHDLWRCPDTGTLSSLPIEAKLDSCMHDCNTFLGSLTRLRSLRHFSIMDYIHEYFSP